ncbi:MAG: L-histidine N(alpha)-methyltransferase [Chloroflexota bacterium]
MTHISTGSRFTLDNHLEGEDFGAALALDVRRGLSSTPKQLPPKYFYDAEGSALFERITGLAEYYPTRAERALLERIAPELMVRLRPSEIVELGSGSASKTRVLLGAPSAPEHLRRYVPFDVSPTMIRDSSLALLAEFSFLQVHGVVGDFERHLVRVPPSAGGRLVLFLGGTIGNLAHDERTRFLRKVSGLLAPGDHLLVGMDMVKEQATIEAAYDDAAGVTAAFNRNVLRVLNRELGAAFDTDAFAHRAFFNQQASRIEMHLVAREAQTVLIPALDMTVHLSAGESIWTESSYKFTPDSARTALADAGLALDELFVHEIPAERFCLALATLP